MPFFGFLDSVSAHTRSKEKKAAKKKEDADKRDAKTADTMAVTAVKPAKRAAVADSKTSSTPIKAPVKKRTGQAPSTIAPAISATASSASIIADPVTPSKQEVPVTKSKKRGIKHQSVESFQLPTPETTPTASTPLPQPASDLVPASAPTPDVFVPEDQTLPSYATSSATKALQKQLKQIIKLQLSTRLGQERYWTLDLGRLDNLYTWYFSLSSFDPDIPLSADMRAYNLTTIDLEVKFGPQHPTSPPFVRILRPRFMQWMNGGGGHVTAGGSICVEMLTMKGWKREYTVDMVLMVVHQALSDTEPVPARLIGTYEYSVHEAVSAYIRVANSHGWRVPQNWHTLFTQK